MLDWFNSQATKFCGSPQERSAAEKIADCFSLAVEEGDGIGACCSASTTPTRTGSGYIGSVVTQVRSSEARQGSELNPALLSLSQVFEIEPWWSNVLNSTVDQNNRLRSLRQHFRAVRKTRFISGRPMVSAGGPTKS